MTYSRVAALRAVAAEGQKMYPAHPPTASGVAAALMCTGDIDGRDYDAAQSIMDSHGYEFNNSDEHDILSADMEATVAAQKWRLSGKAPKLLLLMPGLCSVRLAERGGKKLRARRLLADSAIGHALGIQVSLDGYKLWSRHCDSDKLTAYIQKCAVSTSSVVSMGVITDDVSSRLIEGTPVLVCRHWGYASWFPMVSKMPYPDVPTKTLAAVIDRGPKSFGALSKSTAWNWE